MSVKPTLQGRPAPRLTKAIGYDPTIVTGDAPDPVDRAIAAVFEVPLEILGIALVQSKTNASTNVQASTTTTLDATPTEGNLLFAVNTHRADSSGYVSAPDGTWTRFEDSRYDGSFSNGGRTSVFWKFAGASESATVTINKGGSFYGRLTLAEFSGISAFDVSDAVEQQSSSTSHAAPSISPAAATDLLLIYVAVTAVQTSYTPPASFTEIEDNTVGGGFAPTTEFAYRAVLAPSGSYSATGTSANSAGWGAMLGAFTGSTVNRYAPAPEVNDENDATYRAVAGPALDDTIVRFATDAAYRLARVPIKIGKSAAGSTTLELFGATLADFSDEVSLGTVTYTATGSYSADDVEIVAAATLGLTYYRVTAAAGAFRINTIRLFEPDGSEDAAAVAADLAAHLADPTDAHDASAVSIVDAGGYFVPTEVEGALQALAAAVVALPGDLDDLADVVTAGVSDGDILAYDAGTSSWGPVAPPSGSVPSGTDPGDLLVWDGDSWEVLPIGADDEVLTADSGEALGVKWAAASGGSGIQEFSAYDAAASTVGTTPTSMTDVPDLAQFSVVTAVTCTFIYTYSCQVTKGNDAHKNKFNPVRGSTTIPNPIHSQSVGESAIQQMSHTWVEKGVAAGSYTVKMQYNAAIGTSSSTFAAQHFVLRVIPE